ncbi:MAG: cytochrome c biogenesis protein ResB [Thermomicrobiales bacterium]|nr:cytochrome c biogenesis protein ResB [Thermomicrobiales bacterium]
MAQATVDTRGSRRSPLEMVVDRIWRFFCSVRAAVVEIIILAVLVLLGTLRGSDAPQWLADAIPATQPAVDWLYDWDVFHSLPLMLILGVLCVAIVVCTLNRVPGIWKTIVDPTIRTNRSFLENAELSAAYQSAAAPAAAVGELSESLQKHRYRVLHEERGADIHLYADKNRYAKLGTFPFHLALILILLGGIVGARYGFREMTFVVPEGSVREVGHGTGLSVELIQFIDSWREEGIPSEYRSDLVIWKNGEKVKEGTITVNNPISYDNVTFYQSSYGQAAAFRITDTDGNLLFDDSIPLGQYTAVNNPDAPAGLQQLPQIGSQLNVIGQDQDPQNAPELDDLQLENGQMFLQLRQTADDGSVEILTGVVDPGETIQLGSVNIEYLREKRFTLMQVASNPGIPIFFAASFLLVAGLAVTFYFPHRRIRGIIGPGSDQTGSRVLMAPLARWDWSGQRDFRRIIERIETESRIAVTINERPREHAASRSESAADASE